MQNIAGKIRREQDFVIIGHVSPDGDTIGSGLALLLALQKMGKSAVFFVDGVLPDKLQFLEKYAPISTFEAFSGQTYGCMIAVDVSSPSRLGRFQDFFEGHPNTIVIDHHMTNTGFGKENLILGYGATGQIVLALLEALGVGVDPPIANLLYTAICTDTGNFTYSNTDESILLAAAHLRKAGADIPMLIEKVYKERSIGSTRLIGRAIDRMTLYKQGRISLTYILMADYDELGAKPEDTDELVNYAREISGVEIAVFLREVSPIKYKVSLRSKKYADVSAAAAEFGGGGHTFAAGCTVEGDLASATREILAAVGRQI